MIKAPGDKNPRLVLLHETQEEGTRTRSILKEVSVGYMMADWIKGVKIRNVSGLSLESRDW